MGKQNDNNSKSSRKINLVTVLLVLWLIGLTALSFFMITKSQQESPLEARVKNLEKKVSKSKVGGKITPAGNGKAAAVNNKQLTALNNRINLLEKKIGELKAAQASAPKAASETAAAEVKTPSSIEGPCKCDDLVSRLNKLESFMLAKKTDTKKVTPPKPRAKKKSKKAVRIAKKKRKRKVRVAKRPEPRIEPVFISRPVTPPEPVKRINVNYKDEDKIYDSVYEISRRFGPMYGESTKNLDSIRTLAPGAAIYPGSSTSSYYNSSY